MSAGSMQSGTRPTCRSSSRRRGDAEASTRGGAVTKRSSPQMQHADQREQAAGGVEVERDLIGDAFHKQRGAFVVERPSAHVDRLDPSKTRTADGLLGA